MYTAIHNYVNLLLTKLLQDLVYIIIIMHGESTYMQYIHAIII